MFGVFEVNGPEEPVETFPTGAEAAQAAQARNVNLAEAGSEMRFKVRPIVDDSWKERERRRLVYGEYTQLPGEVHIMVNTCHPFHYAHASKSKPGFVAFTESPEKGMQDRQTRKRAGAYLREYFPNMEDTEVQRLALICDNEAAPRTLQFGSTADEIEQVYLEGPSSCMSYSADSYESSEHPVRAYFGPDLEVGYIETDDKITGRVILWPEQQLYSVIYGDIERMEKALSDAGYTSGSLDGARMRKLEDYNQDGVYIMPYIDGSYAVTDAGDCWEIAEGGEVCANSTEGTTGNGYACSNCGDNLDPDEANHVNGDAYCCDCSVWCGFCEEWTIEGSYIDSYDGSVCDRCRDDNFTYCDGCNEYFADDAIVCHSNGEHCEDCFCDEYTLCVECDDSIAHGDAKQDEHGDSVCEDCAPEDAERMVANV